MEAVLKALVVGAFGLLGAFLGSKYQLRKLNAERFNEREHSFEVAQTGYRACYRKFLVNVSACHGAGSGIPLEGKDKTDVATLTDNFWEASFCGDPDVIHELEEYWPPDQRADGKPPPKSPSKRLLEAMRLHGSRSLKEQDELQKREGFVG